MLSTRLKIIFMQAVVTALGRIILNTIPKGASKDIIESNTRMFKVLEEVQNDLKNVL